MEVFIYQIINVGKSIFYSRNVQLDFCFILSVIENEKIINYQIDFKKEFY